MDNERNSEFEYQLNQLKKEDITAFGRIFFNFLIPALAISHPTDSKTIPSDIEVDLSILTQRNMLATKDDRLKNILGLVETQNYWDQFGRNKKWQRFNNEEISDISKLIERNKLSPYEMEWFNLLIPESTI